MCIDGADDQEPPDAEHAQQQPQQRSKALARGRHRNSDSEDLAELVSTNVFLAVDDCSVEYRKY